MKQIDGVSFDTGEGYAVCHLVDLSDYLKGLIRKNLQSICHGASIVEDYGDSPLYSYVETLDTFFERYDSKADDTKKGMIGELLAHVLLPELFDDFQIATAFFNLEENSIKKGFDLILFKPEKEAAWITEVKSGELHQGKDVDQTTTALLYTARADLYKRLNEQKKTFWLNAMAAVRHALSDTNDYKKVLERILVKEGGSAAKGHANSYDNCVILVSNLFESLQCKISDKPAMDCLQKLHEDKNFLDVMVFCIQKNTYSKIEEFLRSEIV